MGAVERRENPWPSCLNTYGSTHGSRAQGKGLSCPAFTASGYTLKSPVPSHLDRTFPLLLVSGWPSTSHSSSLALLSPEN